MRGSSSRTFVNTGDKRTNEKTTATKILVRASHPEIGQQRARRDQHGVAQESTLPRRLRPRPTVSAGPRSRRPRARNRPGPSRPRDEPRRSSWWTKQPTGTSSVTPRSCGSWRR